MKSTTTTSVDPLKPGKKPNNKPPEPLALINDKVEALLARMTIEEKVGQMRVVHAELGIKLDDSGELVLSDRLQSQIKHGIAGIKNPGEHLPPDQAATINNLLQKKIIEQSRLGIPAFFATESYNGIDAEGTTSFCRPINLAASWNTELVKRVWDVTGREGRLRGMHICHSPEADLIRDPRFGRMSESFGEDTHLTTEMVVAAVQGVQGDYDGLSSTHIGAVTKHFAGYGQVEGGRNFASVQISPRDLIDQIFPPFKEAVQRARTLGIMASHGDLNGIACHANKELLTDVLREQWGFTGYTVSDANDIGRLFFFMGVAEDEDAAALLGLEAGMNVDLYNEDCYVRLPKLAEQNPAIIPLIDRAAGNVLRTKFILGLFENPYADPEKAARQTRDQSALDLALEADLESLILLKNENGLLPLDPSKPRKIALIGPLLKPDTLRQFESVAGATIHLVAEKGFSLTNGVLGYPDLLTEDECRHGLEKAVEAAASADLTVLFVGGDEFTSKEAFFAFAIGDRDRLDLVGSQIELFKRIKALGKPVVIALKHRRTLAITEFAAEADAIIDAWDPGELGDTAIAMTLFGLSNPSGKLPATVPRSVGQLPFHYSQKKINFKKTYLFSETGPLYPFGFGLSYSQFEYTQLELSAAEIGNGDSLVASITITNTGKLRGKEVVQLYIQDLIGSVVRPIKELKAFRKVALEPGESKALTFAITPEMLSCTGIDMKRKVENGDFVVQIGGSSEHVLSKSFKVVSKTKSSA